MTYHCSFIPTPLGEARRSAGLTQEELAHLSGVKLATIQKLERNPDSLYTARTENTLRLAIALGTTVEQLVPLAPSQK